MSVVYFVDARSYAVVATSKVTYAHLDDAFGPQQFLLVGIRGGEPFAVATDLTPEIGKAMMDDVMNIHMREYTGSDGSTSPYRHAVSAWSRRDGRPTARGVWSA